MENSTMEMALRNLTGTRWFLISLHFAYRLHYSTWQNDSVMDNYFKVVTTDSYRSC